MKANVLHEFGGADQFRIEETEKPKAGKGEVLIRIKAIGINPVDTKVRNGSNRIAKNLQLPAIIGWDASGIIASCGEGVEEYREGDEVFGCIGFPGAGGAYAEFAVADVSSITRKPEAVSFEEAAALPIVGLTAYQAINDHLQVQSDQKILIQAAAGGVGHLAVQFAQQNGPFVAGTASTKNQEFLTSLGIDQFIDYKKERFEDQVGEVNATLDAMGGEVLYRSIDTTKKRGKVVCLPSSTKDDPEAIRRAKERDITLVWPTMYVDARQLKEMAAQMASGKLKINLDQVFSFDEMQKAHEAIETHSTRGKIVVKGVE